jgi:lytic cellulose monooxygenase (C1-hydroxylating)
MFLGSYLIRAEMIAFHEGEVSFIDNPRRGAQFYMNCIQIEVTGDGTVQLPKGVSFPGAYKYEDAGIVHNIYCSTETLTGTSSPAPCPTDYEIPGPTVWSGAWAETTQVPLGDVVGGTTATPWSTWIQKSVVTSATFEDRKDVTVVGTSTYEASWSSVYVTPTPGVRW